MQQIRNITIAPVTNGFIVQVGCKTFAFTDAGELLEELRRYIANPTEVECEYAKRYGFPVGAPGIFGQQVLQNVIAGPLPIGGQYYGV